ncbi:class I SAM-dependent methyltransferase [Micropruina sonneratiae]|uniref:class I SAM-dependent methyltransferase n=1 Tax=Micropruina sonneratiae TaxID=2986940 RepID=UPI002227C016|nr:class I SAM-dependent methyltransferase [Micropruina sp. KQZ13P-5]MCW3158614.1 class I SAM-dependent methyltransferase [Micropruina sp. KQZ13P-5]
MTVTIAPDELLHRWDRQQSAYIRHREQRFDTMLRVVERLTGPRPRVLDLACGPGSLTALTRSRLPGSSVVALDKDPVLVAIAADVFAADAAVRVVAGDLDEPAWVEGLGTFDAVVSSTALHWLAPEVLARVYFELAGLIRPGGVFLNGDHLSYDATAQPTLRRLAAEDDEANQADTFGAGADSWDDWWALATGRHEYAEAAAERERCWAGKGGPTAKVTLGYHLETLRSAGFAETGTVWQYLDDFVVAGVR